MLKESSISSRLKFTGVQHVGVTVKDMKKSLEFYTEVLGGQLVTSELGLKGDGMHNCLLQVDELVSNQKKLTLEQSGVPNLREGKQELDVYFVHFGNVNIELLQYRSGETGFPAEHDFHSPAFIGNMHISFFLEDDIDVDKFVQDLEEECKKRGMPEVKCNRIAQAGNEEERVKMGVEKPDSNSFKITEGHFGGWTLFYVKGPNGEQLEFNQVTKSAKKEFEGAASRYALSKGKKE